MSVVRKKISFRTESVFPGAVPTASEASFRASKQSGGHYYSFWKEAELRSSPTLNCFLNGLWEIKEKTLKTGDGSGVIKKKQDFENTPNPSPTKKVSSPAQFLGCGSAPLGLTASTPCLVNTDLGSKKICLCLYLRRRVRPTVHTPRRGSSET